MGLLFFANVRIVPLGSLVVGLAMLAIAWRRREEFQSAPYFHWFLYLHLAAISFHQFEEYGWPGGFHDFFTRFMGVEGSARAASRDDLERLNLFVLLPAFAGIGWLGTRRPWIGLAAIFTMFANGLFHLIISVTSFHYVPGTVTGTVLYLPLGILAAEFAVRRGDVSRGSLLAAFALGLAASFLPFVHAHTWIGS